MIGVRRSPVVFWMAMALAAALAGMEAGFRNLGIWPAFAPVSQILVALANSVSVRLGRQIALEHEQRTAMRLAWNLIAAGALANALRIGYELAFQLSGRIDSAQHTWLGLRQFPIAGSLLLTAAGLAAMWASFTSLGLGLRLRKLDWTLMGCILLLVPPVVWSRASLNDAHSPLAAVRYVQFASPFLLAIPAAMAVALYRISREMGEGPMALALKCLSAAFAMRLLALAVATDPRLSGDSGAAVWASPATLILLVGAHWLLLLGLVYRRQLSHATAGLIEEYEIPPYEPSQELPQKKA